MAATMAATMAFIAVATSMATIAAVALRMATTVTTAASTGATAATMAAMTGNSLLFTAQQGDSDDREKHHDPKYNSSIHPKILHLLTGTVSEKETHVAVFKGLASERDGIPLENYLINLVAQTSTVDSYPVRNICRLRRVY
jgi:hypothetical protein